MYIDSCGRDSGAPVSRARSPYRPLILLMKMVYAIMVVPRGREKKYRKRYSKERVSNNIPLMMSSVTCIMLLDMS